MGLPDLSNSSHNLHPLAYPTSPRPIMKLTLPILATTAAMAPSPTHAWSSGPAGVFVRPDARCLDRPMRRRGGRFADHSMPIDRMMLSPEQLMRRKQQFLDRAMTRVSPRYEITDQEDKVQISLDVPGVQAEDINVTIEDDGKVLSVSAQRQKVGENGSYTSRFSQSFALDPTVDIENFSANLENGVLIVTAPKDLQRIEQNIRKIPVVQGDGDSSTIAADEVVAESKDNVVVSDGDDLEILDTTDEADKDDEAKGEESASA